MSLRVLHVDPERAWGGGEVQVLALAGELAARGVASTIAADPAGALARAAEGRGIPVVPLPVANAADLRAGLRLRRLAADADVVHFHTSRAHALAPFCRRGEIRLIVTRRMDYVPAGGPYVRYLYNHAVDAVIAISEGVRAALVRVGVRPERIRVVPSGIEPERFTAPPGAREALRAAWGVSDDQVLVVAIGALEARKGHAVLLEAARRLAPSALGLRYVICGGGKQEAALARFAESLDGAVRFAGFQPDVAGWLAAADLVAMPSLQEGLGVAALEAMAAGRAVVASRVGGLAEAVVHEETGLLVPPGDPTALATALARLATDPGLRSRLGANGAVRVRARFTAARMAEGTLACYRRAP